MSQGRLSQSELATLFRQSPLPLVLVDNQRRYIDVNQAFAALLGRRREEIIGHPISEFLARDYRPQADAAWEQLQGGSQAFGHYQVVRADGQQVGADYSTWPDVRPGQHLGVTLTTPVYHGPRRGLSAVVGPLSPRESDVLWLLADGATNPQIALALGIAATTVQAHIGSVKLKLRATTRAQAVANALTQGLLPPAEQAERLYIVTPLCDDSGVLVDARLLYLSYETLQERPQLERQLGAPISGWDRGWQTSEFFALLGRALRDGAASDDVLVQPDWAPEGYWVAATISRLGRERLVIRLRPLGDRP